MINELVLEGGLPTGGFNGNNLINILEFNVMKSKIALVAAFAFTLPVAHASAATSTFNADTEGWTVVGDEAGPVTWVSSGGNPGGYISVTDSVVGGVMYFQAPNAFLGNQSAAYGTALTFDLVQSFTGSPNQFDAGDVVLRGSGLTLVYDTANNPSQGIWTPYSVSLTAGSWHLGTLAGSLASEQQMQSALSNLTQLLIRAEYQTGPDTDGLDNVVFNNTNAVPEPSTWAMMIIGLAGVGFMGYRRSRKLVPVRVTA